MSKDPTGNPLPGPEAPDERLKREFPGRLRKLRETTGEKQSQVAKALGFASETVYQLWEKEGGNLPSALNLYKLALHFKVSTDYLLGLEEEVHGPATPEATLEDAEKQQAKRAIFYAAWHGKNYPALDVELLRGMLRPHESLGRCYDRVITDIYLEGHPGDLPLLDAFRTPAAQQAKEEIERLFHNRSPEHARQVKMHVLDLGQVPSERFQRNILGMQGGELMKARMEDRHVGYTLAASGGWLARDVLLSPNLARGDIENVTIIPLTLGRSKEDATSAMTIIGHFLYKHGDYGVNLIDLKDEKGRSQVTFQAGSIDLAFMGIGAFEPSERKSVFAKLLAERGLDRDQLQAEDVIGNVLYHLVREMPGPAWEIYEPPPGKHLSVDIDDPAGDEMQHALSLDILRKLVELRKAQIIILVREPLRAPIVRAALEMRWANSVICTLAVADELRASLLKKKLA